MKALKTLIILLSLPTFSAWAGEGSVKYDTDTDTVVQPSGPLDLVAGSTMGGVAISTGAGDVVGPASSTDNYVVLFNGTSGTLIKSAAVTMDASGNTNLPASANISIGAIDIIDDAAGTATLQNIDAIDATTEVTIEGAIDSLINLVTVGTISSGTWQGTAVADAYIASAATWNAKGDADTGTALSQFAATTSAQFAGVISDETGSGAVVLATSPTLVTPALGTPSAAVLTNATGLPVSGLAGGTDGELITWDSSGNAATVAVGTSGHVLTSNGAGAAPTFQVASGGGLGDHGFRAYRATSGQSISNSTFTKCQLNAEDWDTDGEFDSTTNYRYTPSTAGRYIVCATIRVDGCDGLIVSIYKNGAAYKHGQYQGNAADTAGRRSCSAIVYLNGSTDYIEMYVYQEDGNANDLVAGSESTSFSAQLIAE